MAKRISQLTQLTAAQVASNDKIPIVDESAGVTKYITALDVLSLMYPVGSIYMNASVSTNPGTLLGFGTWAVHGAGRVNVGIDATQTEFDTIGETGGAKTHTLSTSEIPSHQHSYGPTGSSGAFGMVDSGAASSSGIRQTGFTGGGGAHNNLQPYVVVYMWKRTA